MDADGVYQVVSSNKSRKGAIACKHDHSSYNGANLYGNRRLDLGVFGPGNSHRRTAHGDERIRTGLTPVLDR